MVRGVADAATALAIKLAVEKMPSLAPSAAILVQRCADQDAGLLLASRAYSVNRSYSREMGAKAGSTSRGRIQSAPPPQGIAIGQSETSDPVQPQGQCGSNLPGVFAPVLNTEVELTRADQPR